MRGCSGDLSLVFIESESELFLEDLREVWELQQEVILLRDDYEERIWFSVTIELFSVLFSYWRLNWS